MRPRSQTPCCHKKRIEVTSALWLTTRVYFFLLFDFKKVLEVYSYDSKCPPQHNQSITLIQDCAIPMPPSLSNQLNMLFKLSIALHNVEPNFLILTTRSPTHRYPTHQRTLRRFYAEMSFCCCQKRDLNCFRCDLAYNGTRVRCSNPTPSPCSRQQIQSDLACQID